MKYNPEKNKLEFPKKQASKKPSAKAFTPAAEFNPSSEEILAACPEEIPSSAISLSGASDNKRRQLIKKYKDKGRKYKWWTQDDRIRAATVYAMTGSSKKVEDITAIPSSTVRAWRTEDWWPQIIDRIRQEGDDQIDVKLTGLIDKVTDEINERLDKGDFVYDTKRGELVRKKIGGKELSVMTSIFVDKRALLRKKPKMMGETATVNERLKKLADEFSKFIKAKTIDPQEITDVEEATPVQS